MPSFIKEGWIESIEFRNSTIIIGKSTINNNNKLGNRIITGEDAQVHNLEEARNEGEMKEKLSNRPPL